MSKRTLFLIPKDKDTFLEVFYDNYAKFRDWCIDESGFIHLLSPDAQNFILDKEELISIRGNDKEVIEDIIIHFTTIYCGIMTALFHDIPPLMKREYYDDSLIIIEQNCEQKVLELWNYLLYGRSFQDGSKTYISLGAILGYWTCDEQQYLRKELEKLHAPENASRGIKYILQALNDTIKEKKEMILLSS